MKEQSKKLEYFEQENENKNRRIAKKHNKIENLKEILKDFQNKFQKHQGDLVEIEEKNINLAEFIKKEILNKSTIFDPSPTFKDNTLNFTNDDSKTMNKSYEHYRNSYVNKNEIGNNENASDYNSFLLESKSKFKKYGKEAHSQVIFLI